MCCHTPFLFVRQRGVMSPSLTDNMIRIDQKPFSDHGGHVAQGVQLLFFKKILSSRTACSQAHRQTGITLSGTFEQRFSMVFLTSCKQDFYLPLSILRLITHYQNNIQKKH